MMGSWWDMLNCHKIIWDKISLSKNEWWDLVTEIEWGIIISLGISHEQGENFDMECPVWSCILSAPALFVIKVSDLAVFD